MPTKPTLTQRDLSLAYTPGVAQAVLEIARDPLAAFEYTARPRARPYVLTDGP